VTTIRRFGESALLVDVGAPDQALQLAASVAAAPIAGVEAAVPGLRSVLVELDADVDDHRSVELALLERLADPAPLAPGRARTIPVVYGDEHGPDLDAVAAICGMSPDEYARRHAAADVRVLFCGFAPGFAYLGDLPDALRVPRLASPRRRTPAGSVAVAGAMSGIYPAELPGGWRIIGRTPIVLFDAHRDPPTYLAPGDTVRFEPMPRESWPDEPSVPDDW
jgi:KipI family sensor histidine kinase inhibitor